MDRTRSAVTPGRFAQGMTFEMRLATAMQAARPGETQEQARGRFMGDRDAPQSSPLPRVWASAAVDERLSALLELAVAGSLDPRRRRR